MDGRRAGTTPLQRISVTAGKHTVALENPALGLRRELMIDVAPNTTVTKVVNLAE